MRDLLPEQIENLPQSVINQRAENGFSLYCTNEDQISKIPEKSINKGVSSGGEIFFALPQEKRDGISKDVIDQFVLSGGDVHSLSEQEKRNISQYVINQSYFTKGALPAGLSYSISPTQARKVPEELQDEKVGPIVLYSVGKIKKEDLPIEVFANYKTRMEFFRVAKGKLVSAFNDLCDKHGYTESVPPVIMEAFNKKLEELQNEISAKMVEAEEWLQGRGHQMKNPVEAMETGIQELGW